MSEFTLLIMLATAVSMVLGGAISLLAYRAYRRTGTGPLRAVAAGVAVITLGVFAGGFLEATGDADLATAVLTQSSLTAAGFAVLAYSLFGPDGTSPT